MADHGPIGSSGWSTLTDLCKVEGTPPNEGTLNTMLDREEPNNSLEVTNNFNMGGLTLG